MLLRTLFIYLFTFFVIIGYGIIWLFGQIIPIYQVEYLSALLFVSLFLLVIAGLFLLLIHVLGKPLHTLSKAIDSFATGKGWTPVFMSRLTPKEIRLLIAAFIKLTERVKMTHKRDVEVARVKSDFISTAAHQLRTPLTGIRWALEALEQDSNLSEEQKTLVKNAVDKSHDLVSIVNTLLDISSIESGKYRYTFVSINMDDVLQKTVQDFQHLAHGRGVILEYKPPTKRIFSARADRERIQWVLNNLIENAIRYTPSGGYVTVSTGMIGKNMVLVRVHDTGIGIAPGDRSSIFERFYRAGNAIAKESSGSGLGLYIARTIATDHGGDLNFSANTDGVGTTFTFSLPVMD